MGNNNNQNNSNNQQNPAVVGSFTGIGDISMFLQLESMAKSAGSVNGLYPKGYPFSLDHNGIGKVEIGTQCEPGAFVVQWSPTPGVALNSLDPVNAAGSERYSEYRNNNWTNASVDIADLTYYYIACDSLYVLYNMCGLIYTHLQSYNELNRYEPRVIIEGLSCDFEEFRAHEAEFLFEIKKLARKIAILKVPKSFGYLKRHLDMTSCIYKDRDNPKADIIIFAPKYLFRYKIDTIELEAVDMRSQRMTYIQFAALVDSFIDRMLPDEEIGRINADIQNYITREVWTLNDISWDNMRYPIFDQSVLDQLHNADTLPASTITGFNITQQVNNTYDSIIIWNPTFTTTEIGILLKKAIDFPSLEPDFKEVMKCTRFKFVAKLKSGSTLPQSAGASFDVQLQSVGTELIHGISVIQYSSVDMTLFWTDLTTYINVPSVYHNNTPGFFFPYDLPSGGHTGKDYHPDWASIQYLSKLNHAPIMYLTSQSLYGTSDFRNEYIGCLNDTSNLVLMEDHQLRAEHEAALLSAFSVGKRTITNG